MGRHWRVTILPVLLIGCGNGGASLGLPEAGAPDVAATTPCKDDELGNTSQAQSHPLTDSVKFDRLALCPGSEDWFRLEVKEGASFGVSACMKQSNVVPINFTAYREEFGQLYGYTNCGSSSESEYCVGTCLMGAPGVYFVRVKAEQTAEYSFSFSYTPPTGNVSQGPPSFDFAPVLQPGMALELTVCTPFGYFYQLQIAEPSTVTIESTMTYSGYYLDFTLTAENQEHIAHWPQGAGKTRQELSLDSGRYMLRVRSAHSGCRTFQLDHTRVPR